MYYIVASPLHVLPLPSYYAVYSIPSLCDALSKNPKLSWKQFSSYRVSRALISMQRLYEKHSSLSGITRGPRRLLYRVVRPRSEFFVRESGFARLQ